MIVRLASLHAWLENEPLERWHPQNPGPPLYETYLSFVELISVRHADADKALV